MTDVHQALQAAYRIGWKAWDIGSGGYDRQRQRFERRVQNIPNSEPLVLAWVDGWMDAASGHGYGTSLTGNTTPTA